MMQRIVQVVAGVAAAAVILVVVSLVIREQWKPAAEAEPALAIEAKKPVIAGAPSLQPSTERKGPNPGPAVQSPAPLKTEPEPPEDPSATPSPARRLPNRTFTWTEIEEILEKLRQERPSRAEAIDDLESWYAYLASVHYTKSRDLPEHCAKLAEWRREFPQSPNLLVVLGRAHISWAWEARGSGWASTVTEEGWQQFHTRIGEARRLLARAIDMGAKDGEAYAGLITVAMAEGQPVEETRAILDAGMKVDPTYFRMYKTMANYLLPRWHGEPGDIEKLALEVREQVGGDDGLDAYGQIAYEINQYEGAYSESVFRSFDRQLLAQAAEVLVRRYPRARNLPCFAALCTIAAQDHAAARRIQPAVKFADAPRVSAWEYHSDLFHQWCNSELVQDEADWIWGTTFHFGNLAFAADSRYIWCGNGYGPPDVS
jgi:hypothetical protein